MGERGKQAQDAYDDADQDEPERAWERERLEDMERRMLEWERERERESEDL